MEEFLPNPAETPTFVNIPAEPPSDGERLKVILVSSPKVVNSTIRALYKLGFAEVSESTTAHQPLGVWCGLEKAC
jgi:hypothetical protein